MECKTCGDRGFIFEGASLESVKQVPCPNCNKDYISVNENFDLDR